MASFWGTFVDPVNEEAKLRRQEAKKAAEMSLKDHTDSLGKAIKSKSLIAAAGSKQNASKIVCAESAAISQVSEGGEIAHQQIIIINNEPIINNATEISVDKKQHLLHLHLQDQLTTATTTTTTTKAQGETESYSETWPSSSYYQQKGDQDQDQVDSDRDSSSQVLSKMMPMPKPEPKPMEPKEEKEEEEEEEEEESCERCGCEGKSGEGKQGVQVRVPPLAAARAAAGALF